MARNMVPGVALATAGGFAAAAALGCVSCKYRARRSVDEDDDEDVREGFAYRASPAAAVPESAAPDAAATEPVTVEAAPPGYSPLADAMQQQTPELPLSMAIEMAGQMSAQALIDAARRMAQLPPPTIKRDEVEIAKAMFVRMQELKKSGEEIGPLVGHQLYRVFGSFMEWRLPQTEEGDIFSLQGGPQTMLPLCSSDDSFGALKMAIDSTLQAKPMRGWDAFTFAARLAQAEKVDFLALDPVTRISIQIPATQCQIWGPSLRLEAELTEYELLCEEKGGPQPLPPAFCQALALHPALHVLEASENGYRCNEEGAIMILTSPDHLVWAISSKVGKPVPIGPRAMLGFAAAGHPVTVFKGGDLSSQGVGHFENVKIAQGDLARGMAPYIQVVEEEKGVPSLPVASEPETSAGTTQAEEAPQPPTEHRPALPSSNSLD